MDFVYIDDTAGLETARAALDGSELIALDCEAAGYHRYSDRLCLVQLTMRDRTYLFDALAIDAQDVLRPALEDPAVRVLMHGADFDIRLLDRDLDIALTGLFDTQIAASLLGESSLGLSNLLDKRLGIRLSKKYQKADWARRPLPEPMKTYAAHDTAHLHPLARTLERELEAKGRLEWALEEFRELEKARFDPADDGADPVLAIREARDLEPRAVDRLREALNWRDRIGRELDRALFRVVGDSTLVEVARVNPASLSALASIKGVSSSLLQRWGEDLLSRFEEVNDRSESGLVGFRAPRRSPNGARRPTPEVESLMSRLKAVRNERASALGIDRGTLLSNSVLQVIAESPPASPGELAAVLGIRKWQVEVLANDLMAVL